MADGFTKLPHQLVDSGLLAQLSGSAAKVYLVLSRHADVSGRCYPSIGRIATLSGLGEKTVKRSVKQLEELEFIQVERSNGTHNWYQINTDNRGQNDPGQNGTGVKMTRAPGSKCPDNRGQNDPLSRTIEVEPMKNSPTDVGQPIDGGSSKDGQNETFQLTNGANGSPKKSKPRTKAKKAKPEYDPKFLEWYAIYPRHEKPGRAQKAYLTAIKDLQTYRGLSADEAHELLCQKAQAFAFKVSGKKTEFVPHPATWLNDKCYDDAHEDKVRTIKPKTAIQPPERLTLK